MQEKMPKHGKSTEDKDEEIPVDVAEKPGSTEISKEHADEVADEWGEESFPASDPPSHH